MSSTVIVRRYGTFCDVGMVDGSALSERVLLLLSTFMTYTHRTQHHGAARYDAVTGAYRPVEVTTVRLFKVNETNTKLLTCYGYIPKILETLARENIACTFSDITPVSKRGADVYTPRWDLLEGRVEWRPKQDVCVANISVSLGGQIIAPPAFGKSYVMRTCGMLYPKAKIHISIKRADLVEDTVRIMRELLPSVGQVGDGKKEFGHRITVFTAGSLHHSDGDADFLFVDEAHEMMTPNYANTIARTYNLTRCFALTATPERKDGADAKLEYLFGPEIFYMTWPEAVELGLILPITVQWVPIHMDYNPCHGKEGVPKLRWGVWRNDYRNQKIAEVANRHDDDEQVLILVQTLEHAVYLHQHLPHFTMVYGQASDNAEAIEGFIRNKMLPDNYRPVTADQRLAYKKQFEQNTLKKVIATDIWSTGVSFNQLGVLIRADARGAGNLDEQGPGRVSRIHPESGKESGLVYDMFDFFDSGLKRKAQERSRNYARLRWTQHKPRMV